MLGKLPISMTRRSLLTTLIGLVFLTLSTIALPEGFVDDPVGFIDQANGIAFARSQNGTDILLVASKTGQLWVFESLEHRSQPKLALDLSDVLCTDVESGLQGVAAHPSFAENRIIYLYYTYQKHGTCVRHPSTGPVNRLVTFILHESNTVDRSTQNVLLETQPLEFSIHNAGDIKFGKDGMLYLTIGDGDLGRRAEMVSQKLDNLLGKVLRLTPDGGIPSDNPFTSNNGYKSARCNLSGKTFPDTACEEIFVYGLRHPFRFCMDPNSDEVRFLVDDVGGKDWEEVNECGASFAGKNYGWPIREGPCKLATNTSCAYPGSLYEEALYWYPHDSRGGAVTGCTIVPNGVWPLKYDDVVIFADFVFDEMYLLTRNESQFCRDCSPPTPGWSREVFHMQRRPISLLFAPYGDTQALYYTTFLGENTVRLIRYIGTFENQPPVAQIVLNTDVRVGVGVAIEFDGRNSSDPNGDLLLYSWDFGDGSELSAGSVQTHSYTRRGTFLVSLLVRDESGQQDTDLIEIVVGDPPVAIIDSPPINKTFSVGERMTLVGTAKDSEGNALPNSKLRWEVRQHHNTHYHPFLSPTPGNGIELQGAPRPEDFLAATNSYLEIIFTVEDDNGVSTTVSRTIQPKLIYLSFDSEPSGLDLLIDGYQFTTPQILASWQNYALPVEAIDEYPYVFDEWSDGGNKSHTILVADGLNVFTAVFLSVAPSPVELQCPVQRCWESPDKCGLCQGHCRSDDNCKDGLVCYKKPAGGYVPGCVGYDISATDWCVFASVMLQPTPAPVTSSPTTDPEFPEEPITTLQRSVQRCWESPDKCGLCQGHCRSDDNCKDGLVCYKKPAGGYVPGCVGYDISATDWCVLASVMLQPTPAPVTSSPTSFPTTDPQYPEEPIALQRSVQRCWESTDKCGLCQGHCRSDDNCKDGLVCYKKPAGGYVPGCVGYDISATDWCVLASLVLQPTSAPVTLPPTSPPTSDPKYPEEPIELQRPVQRCSELPDKCGLCQGHCSNDDDCKDGLICFQKPAGGYVPGCIGYSNSATDWCVLASATLQPTSAPVTLPPTSPPTSDPEYPEEPIELQRPVQRCWEFPDKCGLCQGHCSSDDDCKDGLICFQKPASGYVPGCIGYSNSATDWCVLASATLQPT